MLWARGLLTCNSKPRKPKGRGVNEDGSLRKELGGKKNTNRDSEIKPGNQGSVDTVSYETLISRGRGKEGRDGQKKLETKNGGHPSHYQVHQSVTDILSYPQRLRPSSDFSQFMAWVGTEPGDRIGNRTIPVLTTELLWKKLVSCPFLPLIHTSNHR